MFLNEGFHAAVALSALKVWMGNPRKTIDPAKLAELAASVKSIGVQQPLVVRPCDDHLEVVAGQRRYLAAELAGLETVPCVVRYLDDDQALEVAIAENAARADISPIEEAEAIDAYLRGGARRDDEPAEPARPVRTVEQAADRFGHTVAWVQARRRLLSLTPAWRERVSADTCPLRHAEFLARFSVEVQNKLSDRFCGAAVPAFEGFEHEVRYVLHMLRLAPFPVADETYPGGSCDACSSRSDKQRELFSSDARADMNASCLDPKCWDAKVEHRWAIALKDSKKRKLRVLGADEIRLYNDGSPYFDAPWVSVETAQRYKLPASAIVRAPSGLVVELVAREAFEKARNAALESMKNSRSDGHGDDEDEDGEDEETRSKTTKRQAAEQRRRDAQTARLRSIVAALRGPNARALIVELEDCVVDTYNQRQVRDAFGLPSDEEWSKIVERSSEEDLFRFAVVGQILNVHDDDSIDELIARFGAQSKEFAAVTEQVIEQLTPTLNAAGNAAELGDAWAEILAEDHGPSLPELARRWNARAAALGVKSAEIKRLRKAKRAPDESSAA